jgi:xylulokinase
MTIPENPCFIVFDLGSQSLRASVFDSHGYKYYVPSRAVNTQVKGNKIEQDAFQWWNSSVELFRYLTNNDWVRRRLAGIGYIGTGYGVIAIGKDGEPLSKAITYYDARAEEESVTISNSENFKKLSERYGYTSSRTNILEKILWIKNNEPEVYDSTRVFLDPTGYFFFKATGEAAIDRISASKLYANPYGDYPLELLAELGIDPSKLPKVVNSVMFKGELKNSVAEEVGIGNVPVIYLAHDSNCALLGSGVTEKGILLDNSGTGTSLKVFVKSEEGVEGHPVDFPILPGKAFFSSYVRNTGIMLEGYRRRLLSGGFLELNDHLNEQHDTPYIVDPSYTSPSYALEDFELEKIVLYESPNLENSREVILKRKKGRGSIEYGDLKDNNEFTRAVAESLAFPVRRYIEELKDSGVTIDKIVASGGISRHDGIAQIKADVVGLPVYKILDETTSLGGAIMVAAGTGLYENVEEAARNMVWPGKFFEPNEMTPGLEDRYASYIKLVDAIPASS